MANTITNVKTFVNQKRVVTYLTLVYVDAQETDYVVYDSSAIATTLGISDTLDSTILSISACVNAVSTARVFLEWDATTDVNAFTLPVGRSIQACYEHLSGLPNQGGSGKTGDITLTTTGLAAGDSLHIILETRIN